MEEFEKLINDYFDGDEDAEKRLDYFIDDEIGRLSDWLEEISVNNY